MMLIAKQKKAEEKARKEEEKAQKARLAEEAKARKQERNKQQKTNTVTNIPNKDTSCLGKRSASSNRGAKKAHLQDETGEHFNQETQCCVCFADDYTEGDEWVRCTCGLWLHEECILDVIEDLNGLPRLCPFCIS